MKGDTMKTAATYSRVSTEEQVKNTSLKGQLDACRDYATHQGFTILKEVAEDFSGTRLDRPGLTELRDMAHNGEIQAVVVYEADRLSRKLAHLLLLQEEFDKMGAELLFVNSQDDTTSPEGRMFFQMRGAFGEYEKAKITERLRLGKMRLAKQGKAIGNHFQPLGYIIQDGQYVVVEEEARIVRLIFEWAVSDRLSIRGIGLRLTKMAARTKRGNTHWAPSSVQGILDNSIYAGTAYWNRHQPVTPKTRRSPQEQHRKVEKSSSVLRDPSEWIALPCPAIVPKEIYEAAQKQLQINKERSPRNTRRSYLLRGLMKCQMCGYSYCGRGSKYKYYYCGGKNSLDQYRASYTGAACPSKWLRAEHLEVRVWDYIKGQITDEAALLAAFEQRDQITGAELQRDQAELETQSAIAEKLRRKEAEMLDLYSDGIISREVLRERLAGIHKSQESALASKQAITARMDKRGNASATPEEIREYCANAKLGAAYADANPSTQGRDHRRDFLEMLETSIVIDEKEIHISGIITGRLPLFEAPEQCLLRSGDAPLPVGRDGGAVVSGARVGGAAPDQPPAVMVPGRDLVWESPDC
jgi:site-specific DNA recombinase